MIGVPEGEEGKKRIKNIFEEILAENCPNPKKETGRKIIQVLEAQRVLNKMNPNRTTLRHIVKQGKI